MEAVNKSYLPAAGRDWALPLYDPLTKCMGTGKAHRALIDQAALQPKQRVLDIGCGTGTLAVVIKRLYPDAAVTGLDPDPKALARAGVKARTAAAAIHFDQGYSDALPYAGASFERVFSSFMFHHVPPEQKGKTLREVRRVLSAGGSLHLLDFERPAESEKGLWARLLRSIHHLRENSEERIVNQLRQAGFASVKKVMSGRMMFGLLRIVYYKATVD